MRTHLRACWLVALAASVGLVLAPPARAETFRLTVATGHPANFLWVAVLRDHFIPNVDRELAAAGGKHKIEWNQAYATLLKPGGEVDAVQTGVADMAFVPTLFVEPKLPLQNVTYVTPFVTDDVLLVTKVLTEMHDEIAALRQTWDQFNQVYLDGASVDTYHLLTTFPVRSRADLKGRKIGTQGPSALWFQNTGAVTVAATLAVHYNNIKTGVYEGGVAFITGAYPPKIHEVAPHVAEINFGAMYVGGLSVNKALWNRFPPEVQQAFRKAAAGYRDEFARLQKQNVAAFTEKMKQEGARFSPLSPEARREWAHGLPNLAQQWVKRMEDKGLPGTLVLKTYMEKMRKAGARPVRDWDRE